MVGATKRYCERVPRLIEQYKRRGIRAWQITKDEYRPHPNNMADIGTSRTEVAEMPQPTKERATVWMLVVREERARGPWRLFCRPV